MGQEKGIKYDFETLMQLLFITANEIAYPENVPVNKSDKVPATWQRKYNVLDWRNITDNHGWLAPKIDYSKFKPKSYLKEVQQEVLQRHLKAIQKKQQLLKQFKHHEDFDRIDFLASQKSNTYQNHIEKIIFAHALFSAILSRVLTVSVYNHHFSNTLWRHTFKRIYMFTLPLPFISTLFYQVASPVNHEYFRSNPKDVRMYEAMAYDVDAFQYNNDIKYNFKYPERTDFNDTVKHVYDKKQQYQHYDAIKYYKKIYGIVDSQPFLNKNEKKSVKQSI